MKNKLENLDDESLMERVLKHDHQAFSLLAARHANMFYTSAYRILMDRQEAEDTVQDAYLKLWDNPKIWKKGKGAKFTSWFYKIVMNLAIDKYRRNKKISNIDITEQEVEVLANQDKDMEMNEEQKILDMALKSLPENQFIALNLCFYEEMSRKEAAKIMKVSVKALESLLMRAKAKLKNQLIYDGYVEIKEGSAA